MPDTPLLLGVDLGTSSTKAVLIDGAGGTVAAARAPTPFVTRGERTEMGVDSLLHGLAGVLEQLGDARARVVAAGLAGMAESGAPLDRSGKPLAPVIAWHDGRGEEAVAALEREFGADLSMRIGQRVRPVLTAAKLAWLVGNGVAGVAGWLGVPELCLHALTGVQLTEFSLAVRTGCYDVAARQWIPEVATALGYTVEVFPAVAPAGATMGTVSHDGAGWSGLPAGTPVTIAGHDHLAGMAGAGVGAGQLGNSVGTAETIVARSAVLPDLAAALSWRVAVTLYPGGTEWAGLVSAARAGIVLETVATALGQDPARLDRLAAGVEAEPDGGPLLVDDAVIADLAARKAEAVPSGSPGRVWAGVLHALVGRTIEACGRLTALLGEAESMVLFGGGSVSEPWFRAKAERLDLPVRRSVGGTAVARGAAVHAGVAAGWWPSADAAPPPQASAEARPPPGGEPRKSSGGRRHA